MKKVIAIIAAGVLLGLGLSALGSGGEQTTRLTAFTRSAPKQDLLAANYVPTTTTTAPPPPPPVTTPKAVERQQKARSAPTRTQPSGSRQACILARENGGDYGRSSNPTHFGAYQFDQQTWAANGGDPAHWGNASPAEQDAVFNNTVAHHGYSAWAPYDGC